MNKKKSKSIIKRVVSLFFVFLFFLFGQHVFISWTNAAMDEVWIIRQGAVNASTCNTTSRICSSLASWEDTADGVGSRNLVTEDKTVTARIEGNWTSLDATAVAISGWTTDATHYIRIYTATEARHSGKWETNKYILSTGLFGTAVISNSQAYTRIEGLQIQHSGSGSSSAGISSIGNAGVVVKDSLVRKSSAIAGEGIKVTGTSVAPAFIINSIAYGGWDIGINVATFGGYSYAYDTVSYGNNYGYRGFYDQNLKNCIGASNTISDFSRQSNYSVNITTCASSDATATSFTDIGSRINQTFSFVDPANGDFHLAVSDAGAKDFGTDLSADIKYAFSTDIDGQARSGSWDIGADEYSSGVPDTTNPSIPTGLSGTATSISQINLSWTASTDNVAVTGYKIYRDSVQIATTVTNSYSNTGLSSGTAYSYTVEAYDGSGNVSGQSSSISATTQAVVVDITSPTTPTSFTATPVSSSQINLSWTASTDNVAVTGYKIYKNGIQINTTTSTNYSDTGLSASTAYSYTVSAYDAAGNNSLQTTAVSATTQAVVSSTISGAPVLNFSDLTSGPKTGLGDGLGSGAIVTIWGTNLGSSQGTSKVYIGDVEASYVYDWADATPHLGHPADLYTYHKMQTIAFSVPATALDGVNTIKVVVGGVTSNTLPFTVRAGNIFWVKGTGNNSTGNGSWSNPWATFGYSAGASEKSAVTPGAIIYGVNVTETASVAVRAKDGTADSPIAMVGYPLGYLRIRKGGLGIWGIADRAEHWVFSKWDIVSDGDGITPTNWGRAVGNSVTDSGGNVPRVDCAEGSASALGGGDLDGTKMYGNYIHGFGCYDTSNQHHTTYFSRRNKGYHGEPFDLGWNYFADNQARGGIHIYDEHDCWGFTTATPVLVHDNVSINQVSLAFGVQAWACDAGRTLPGNFDIYNNLFINAGQKGLNNSEVAVIQLQGEAVTGRFRFYNNTIYGYGYSGASSLYGVTGALNIIAGFTGNSANRNFAGSWEWKNNIVVDSWNLEYAKTNIKSPVSASNNLWYNGGDGNPSVIPSWDTSSIISNPLFSNTSTNDFSLQQTSPAINAGTNLLATLAKDILGISRLQGSSFDIGAFEYNEGSPSTPQPTPPDTTPNSFAFTPQTDVALSTLTTSNTITVSGIDTPTSISISGGTNSQYSINGGAYTNISGTVTNGQTVTVRQTSSSSNNTQTSTTLNIGGVTSIFNITTISLADATAPTSPTITINNNDSLVNNPSTILTLSATDNIAVTQMKFSADNLSWTTAEAYATTKNWSLLGVDGLKTVYVQFGDASNNWSVVASDTITLDTTAPAINTPTITNLTTSTATISFTTTESANTAIDYGLTSSYGNNQIITPTTARSTTHTITLSNLNDNTTYNYQLTANDLANNQNSSTNLTFTTIKAIVVDTTAPSAITNLNINNIGTNSFLDCYRGR